MSRKLLEYNHRFNDLAEVLRSSYESSLLQEKITALIQPIREKKIAVRTRAKHGIEESAPFTSTQRLDKHKATTSHQSEDEPLLKSPKFTSVLSADDIIYDKRSAQRSPNKRSELLLEDMDKFKDEFKLDEFSASTDTVDDDE